MFGLNKKILIWLFSLNRLYKRLVQVAYDIFAAMFAFLLALYLRLETIDYFYLADTYIGILLAVTQTFFIFVFLGLYKNITRYISIQAAISIIVGSFLSCTVLLSSIFLLNLKIPPSVSLIFGVILCLFIAGMRFYIRYLSQNLSNTKRENVVIYGTGSAGIQLNEALRSNPNYEVKLFVDDKPELDGKNLGGVQIRSLDNFVKKFNRFKIEFLLISDPSKVEVIYQKVFDTILDYPIKIIPIPSITDLISGKFKINHVKEIKIETLLGRKPVQYNPELMGKLITKKTVLVTGAGGSIGSELCRQIIMWKPKKIILIDSSEFAIYNLLEELKDYSPSYNIKIIPLIGSVQDKQFCKKIFDHFVVDIIYHAAAYKHVPLMEQNVMQCIKNNTFGTLNISELAIAAKVKHFILISSDKAVNPVNLMGVSKRFAEIICQTLSEKQTDTCFSIVRFGNVLGSSGSVVPKFTKQIQRGGPVTLTHLDMTRYFMTVTEAAQLVIQAGSIAKGGDVFVLDMGEPIRMLDLAKKLVILSGLRPILNSDEKLKNDEIRIIISGLRPGEKLFEELSYSSNLIGTIHPRINTSIETHLKYEELQKLLATLLGAISNDDYQTVYKTINNVFSGFPKITNSSDIFT